MRAEGCHLYDSAGHRYVDLESGVWCTAVGHGHPRILEVMSRQSAQIAHAGFNYTSAVVEETAREIDCAIREIVDRAFAAAHSVLEHNLLLLQESAQALLERETLTEAELHPYFEKLEASGDPA